MSKTLSAEFEFEIGDVVMHRHAGLQDYGNPEKFVVLERLIQQCHGGIQTQYLVRAIGANGGVSQPFHLTGREVTAYLPESEIERWREEQQARRKAEREAMRERSKVS